MKIKKTKESYKNNFIFNSRETTILAGGMIASTLALLALSLIWLFFKEGEPGNLLFAALVAAGAAYAFVRTGKIYSSEKEFLAWKLFFNDTPNPYPLSSEEDEESEEEVSSEEDDEEEDDEEEEEDEPSIGYLLMVLLVGILSLSGGGMIIHQGISTKDVLSFLTAALFIGFGMPFLIIAGKITREKWREFRKMNSWEKVKELEKEEKKEEENVH